MLVCELSSFSGRRDHHHQFIIIICHRRVQLLGQIIIRNLYRQGHSTETALLDVLDSVHIAADSKEVTLLNGLDLSAAFDTVFHSTLIKRLQTEFGVSGTALSWI